MTKPRLARIVRSTRRSEHRSVEVHPGRRGSRSLPRRKGSRFGHSLIGAVALLAGLLVAPVSPATAATLSPEADTYVDQALPTRNFGGSTSVRVEGDPQRITYLRYQHGAETTGVLKLNSVNNSDHGYKVYAVNDDSWGERAVTWATRPPLGDLLGTTGPIAKDRTYTVNVSAAMTAGQPLSLALVTDDPSGLTLGSREGGKPVALIAPAPPAPSRYTVERVTNGYRSTSDLGAVYDGTLKFVVEQAVLDLDSSGGGTVKFADGDFNLGTDNWELNHIARIAFVGSGIDNTLIRNSTDVAKDTEPFDFTVASEITIKDLTVNAGGPFRSTSDAIDFDAGNDSLVENVKVTGSRARGIVFDGKGAGWTADRNMVRNCQVLGVPTDGIELLASRNNVIENCTIIDAGGHGIQLTKASTVADQPNKTTDDNTIQNNVVTNSGLDGINVNSGSRNKILANTVTNSSDDTAGRDGIRISGNDAIPCDDNEVRSNTATDTQSPKTQKYGVNIATSLCHRTVLDSNTLSGNLTGDLRDGGSGTIMVTSGDAEAPSAPPSVSATATSPTEVDVTWDAATDNVGVTGYHVYREGSLLTTVAGDTLVYTDATATAGATYTYSVTALDAAGHESPATQAAPVTTPSEPSGLTQWVPVEDTYVTSASPGRSYGSSLTLRTDNDPIVRSYLRFNVTGAQTGPHTTVLRIYASSSHSTGIQVRSVSSSSWNESTTFASDPGVGAVVLGTSGPLTSGTYAEVDLGNLVTADGVYELAITDTTNTAISMASSESSNSPELVLRPVP
jgi:parallel beta-helix repeat protein